MQSASKLSVHTVFIDKKPLGAEKDRLKLGAVKNTRVGGELELLL